MGHLRIYSFFFTDYHRLTTIFANANLQVVFALIFRYVFRKFSENINKTLIAARPLSARDSRNVMYLFGFGVVDKKMFYTSCNIVKAERKGKYTCSTTCPSIKGSDRQQGCPREDLPPSVLFFIGTLSQTLTLRAPLSIPPTPFSRGRSRPSGSPSPQDSPARQLRPGI